MVNMRTYSVWRELAKHPDLPDAALPTVIEALCAPPESSYSLDDRAAQWRAAALKEATPVLLARTQDAELRARLIEHTEAEQLAELAAAGTVTAADVPAFRRHGTVQPSLIVALARHPGQVDAAAALLPRLSDGQLDTVVTEWRYGRHRPGGEDPGPLPRALFDALVNRALTPYAAALAEPEQHEGWVAFSDLSLGWRHQFGSNNWSLLATCPERWPDLVTHPRLGTIVQHLLLDHAEATAREERRLSAMHEKSTGDQLSADEDVPEPALSEELLRACLPALCCPELAALPKPGKTARQRLHHIAERVRHNPRLTDIAAEQLHAAADECVRRGRLLTPPRTPGHPRDARTVAKDLALLSNNTQHLAKACALLAALPQPSVISRPSGSLPSFLQRTPEQVRPARLLEDDYQQLRVEALTALAGNPHTPRTAVTDALASLHPSELDWITDQAQAPEWLREHAAALAPADEDDGVLRLLTDDELDRHPDPAGILQSWLDAPASDGLWTRGDVHCAILASRHHTLDHLRQMPATDVLTRTDSHVALPIVLAHCDTDPDRWAALLTALDVSHSDGEEITFGQFLDRLIPSRATSA